MLLHSHLDKSQFYIIYYKFSRSILTLQLDEDNINSNNTSLNDGNK